jgi:hypothetical protein
LLRCLKGRFQPVLLFYELPDLRKDSSVGLFSISDAAITAAVERQKSASVSSIPGGSSDLLPASIEEEAEEEMPSPHKTPQSLLSDVAEDAALSPGGASASATSDAAPGSTFDPTSSASSSASSITTPTADVGSSAMDLETDREFEMAELQRRTSTSQNISPVSAAIAMCPRTISMNSPCSEGEYDVRFGDALLLGMYLEKVDNELCVTSFPRGVNGGMFGAEKSGQIGLFDAVVQANGHPLQHYQVDRALKMIKAQQRPLIIRFRRSKRVQQLVDMGFAHDVATAALQKMHGNVQAAANICFEGATGK